MKTFHQVGRIFRTVGWLCFVVVSAQAFQESAGPELHNFDKRASGANLTAAVEKGAAVSSLRARLPGARVDFDERSGTPKWILAERGFLGGSGGGGTGVGLAAVVVVGPVEEHQTTKTFLREHAALFGFGPEVLTNAIVKQDAVTKHNGLRTVVWQQEVDGIRVFEGLLISHTTTNNELVNLSSQFIPNPERAADVGTPDRAALLGDPLIPAARAVALAAQNLEVILDEADVIPVEDAAEGAELRQQFRAVPLTGDAETKLLWLPINQNSLRLCWEVVLTSRARGEMYRVLIDAQSGEALVRHRLTEYLSDATYRVFTSDSPSPFSPSCDDPCTTQPPIVARSLVTLSAWDTNASPAGWINDGGNETLGNNVDAHTDRDDNDAPDLPRPQGSPFRTFDFALDLTQAPTTYTNAAATELFYWCNWMHDKLYDLGFTEAAGNFQYDNFGRGGFGNDRLQADAQDGGGFNNANMSTPSDGSPPRMQMYVFNGPTPDRDGDFDHEIVLHEYTHGLSNRRVGGGVGLSALQSRGMGEGWSDWYALTLLSEPGDDVNGVYAKGAYATYLLSGMTQNYYFGIRRYPYSTDMTKNPLTFKDIDPTQASTHAGIPRSPIIGSTADEVHNQGEVWCVTLWEARANLVSKYGYAVGNELILQLVTDGMNLSPANPNFLQSRDAILQADVLYNGGADLGELWAAFAKRGMGYSATSPSSSTTVGLVEAYDIPDSLGVTPGEGFTGIGPIGGPFSPNSTSFDLVNLGTNAVNWSGSITAIWLTLSQNSGVIAPGGNNLVNVTVNPNANLLTAGVYNNTVRFTNVSSGVVHSRVFTLRVGQPDYFTELFDGGDNDLDNQTLTFTPDGSGSFYSVCREPALTFPTTPTGGINISLGAHTFTTLTLATNISIYGINASTIYLASEGHLTLLSGDSSGSVTLANHFSRPRVSASLAHIHPTEKGGTVSWLQLSNRVAITFNRVVEWGTQNTNSFQIELFYNGRIRMTHLACATTTGLVGLSAGTGVPADFLESDLSGYGSCALPLSVSGPTNATEGVGVLTGQVNIFSPAATNVTVTLTSSDNTEMTVQPTVTILAGLTKTNFNVTVEDDAELDGVQLATISASAPGYVPASSTVPIADNETAVLSLSVPATATEGVGSVSGNIQASVPPTANIVVSLNSSDTTEIQLPPTVILPAGQTSVVFSVAVVNDTQIDGAQLVNLTAHVANWTDGFASLTVNDNEPTNLVVTLPASAREGNGVLLGAGQVRIAGTLPANLLVSLLSADTTELNVPPTATILVGQTSAAFNLTIEDDAVIDSSQNVTVVASAAGFSSGSTNMVITDNESPPEPFSPSPAQLATNVIQTSDLAWQSGAVLGEIITNEVYFGTTPTPGPSELVGITTSTTWVLPTLMPQTTYYWQIIARKAGVTPGPVWQFTTRGLDHFVWDVIPSPQYVSQPFAVTVTAKDAFETTVTNFTGPVNLSGATSAGQVSVSNSILVIETYSPIANSVRAALTNLGLSHDFVSTATLSSLTLSNYGTVILGMDGGLVTYADMAYAAAAVNSGTKLIVLGGTALSDFAMGMNDFFLRINTNNYSWTTVAGSPDISVTNPGHPLAAGLPATYNLANNYASYYMARVTDGGATTVVLNGDGFPCLTTKPVGAGSVVLFINSASDSYWGNVADFNVLRTVISNALQWVQIGSAQPIPITPTVSGPFVNGVWAGNLTALAPTTNVLLRAADSDDHDGLSNPFAVELRNDVAVAVADSPDPVSLGGNITYTITVTNIGPAAANGVLLTNLLSPGVSLVSATPSQGTVDVFGSTIVCNLLTLGGTASATVTIVATTTSIGTLTNQTTVSRSDADAYLANNSAVALTTVQVPSITINDVSVFEGNAGTANAVFTVSVSPAPAAAVSVNFATVSSSAASPADFIATNGILHFAIGETNRSIAVAIVGDPFNELDETYTVNLSAAVNATLADSAGLGTIRNNDPIPTVSVGDVELIEGNTGTKIAHFPVTLSAASGLDVTVNYFTADGNATSGSDYVARSGLMMIPAGSISNSVAVTVNGDLSIEPDEVFYVDLTYAANATLLQREGYALIENDDGLPGEVDHFVWSPIASPQYVNHPFGVTITALDAFNNPAVYFNGPALLSASTGFGATNVLGTESSTFTFPIYTGYTAERTQVIYPAAELGGAGRITALALDVASVPGIALSNWTIRIKPTALTNYTSYLWESTNWTVVYQTNLTIAASGWAVFNLATPFDYDGTNSLMVDFSFYNSTTYGSGTSRCTAQSSVRSLYYYTSSYGNPLTWSGSSPFPYSAAYTPNLQLIRAPGEIIPIQPAITGTFTNGVWVGSLTAMEPATNVLLGVTDTIGHFGYSGRFVVGWYDDVGISVTDSPDPVSVGADLTYTISVTNSGPNVATGVVVTNTLPSGVTLLAVTPSQGSVTTNGQFVVGDLGSIAAGNQANIVITVNLVSSGILTNIATVSRTGPDNYVGNNVATNTTTVVVPALSINDVSVMESAGGGTNLMFTVNLSVPSAQTVAVNFATANGTALAGSDYTTTNGTLNFFPGQTNQTLNVPVLDDAVSEPNETISVVLSTPVNAVIGKASGLGIILDNDGPPEFQISALLTNNSKVVDHNTQTSDDRGGIAISTSQAFITGDSATARFAASDLTAGVSLGIIRDSLCTDLRTETVYMLGNGSTPLTSSGGTVTTLIELSGTTGLPTGVVLPLSQSFSMTSYGNIGIFSGYGRVVVYNGTGVYDIYIPTGTVTFRGAMTRPAWYSSESWAVWGVAEYIGGELYLTYRDSGTQRIVRSRVPDGQITAVATFSNLSDMASFVVSPSRNRWYFHYEGGGQFGGSSETLGYADAQFSFISSNPPVIVSQPVNQTVWLGETATFNVTVTGSGPLIYQWRKGGTNLMDDGRISGALTNRLTILNVQTNDAGLYSVWVTNFAGAVLSSNATLVVNVPAPPPLPFSPVPTNFATGVSVHTLLSWNGSPGNFESPAAPDLNDWEGAFDFTTGQTGASGPHQNLLPSNSGAVGGAVLWDLTHGVFGDYQPSGGFSSLVSLIASNGFTVTTTSLGITNLNLTSYDVLVICLGSAWNSPYSNAEVTAIQNFVAGGGGLIVLGDNPACPNANLNPVVNLFGVTCGTAHASGSTLSTFTNHPTFQGCSQISLAGGGALSVIQPTTTIAWSGTGQSVIAATDGNGKVLVFGDINAWENSYISNTDNQRFAENVFEWVSQGSSGSGEVHYDVYFGTNSGALALIATNLTQTTCNPGTLAFNTTYYWQIVASNAVGSVTGPVWQFTTALDEVHFASATTSIAENGGVATITVTRENPAGGILNVQYATTNGTAIAGADYTAVSGTLQFLAGVMSTNFQVTILDDAASESAETVLLRLTQPSANVLLSAPSNATLTILDNDAVQVSLFYDAAYVDTGSTIEGEATNVIAALKAKSCQVKTFSGITPAAFSNALAGAGILYIPELENGDLGLALSASTKSVISNFVASGGGLIINGQGQNRDENFINQVFGHSLVSASSSSTTLLTGAAAGTAFTGGPANLPENNGTYEWLRSSLPAGSLSIYQDSGALYTTVAVIPRGAGKIVFLAYDWFDAVPRGTQDGGWDEVLRRALLEAVPLPPPVITNQPQNQISIVGSNASFTVGAVGNPPLRYQWRKSAVPLNNQTNATLNLMNVQTNDAGIYSVVVSNAVGSVTSSNALLTVVDEMFRPVIANDGRLSTNGQFAFTVNALPGTIVVIEASTNLTQWTPVHTNLIGDVGAFLFYDLQTGMFAHRFYRAGLYNGSLPPPAISTQAANLGFEGGRFGFKIGGVGGQGFVIEASTNLVTWVPLQTNILSIGPFYFSDPGSGSLPQCFYRIRLVP